MRNLSIFIVVFFAASILFFAACNGNKQNESTATKDSSATKFTSGGFESQVKWGEHLVLIAGCNDCHTPKKMGVNGPEPDFYLALSGHPAKMPAPDVDRKAMESKGLAVTNDLTSWVGPWGISYASNITSDDTGIGGWTEDQFLLCMHKGKWKGMEASRQLLPPMPWQELGQMSDEELKAIFAYLKSTKPIQNIEPPIEPPLLAAKK